MTLYAIGVGGSGARCVEALVHLTAAGLLPAKAGGADRLYVGLVDPDVANGNVMRAQALLSAYMEARAAMPRSQDLLRTELVTAPGVVWSVLRSDTRGTALAQPNVQDVLEKQQLAGVERDQPAARLMDVLYTRAEQQATLDVGFRGRPAIGSAVFAKTPLWGANPFWDDLIKRLREDDAAGRASSIVFFGSIFGGTGAAGVPTLARLVADQAVALKLQSVRIATVVLLPYFSFGPVAQGEVAASASAFDVNTKAALDFYRSRELLDSVDGIYLIGEGQRDLLSSDSNALGGPAQRNPPHVVELCAGLAALDFCAGEVPAGRPVSVAARRSPALIKWQDLPHNDHALLRERLVQLARFSLALNQLFVPALVDLANLRRLEYAPWFVDYFIRRGATFSAREARRLQNVCAYTYALLEWLGAVSRQLPGIRSELFDLRALPEPVAAASFPLADKECLNSVVRDAAAHESLSLHDVWERVCRRRARSSEIDSLTSLLCSIHTACQREA